MFYGNNVQDSRRLFYSSWEKHRSKLLLSDLEKQIVEVIIRHPEYHALLESSTSLAEHSYFPELGQTNPFLHMGLHLALRDQIATNRPAGISSIYQQLLSKHADRDAVEHLLMESLAECLWQAQRDRQPPDEQLYLLSCKQHV